MSIRALKIRSNQITEKQSVTSVIWVLQPIRLTGGLVEHTPIVTRRFWQAANGVTATTSQLQRADYNTEQSEATDSECAVIVIVELTKA